MGVPIGRTIGRPEERARNFSVLAIGYAFSSFLGPTFAGYSIDHFGHAATFGFFGLATLFPIGMLVFNRRITHVGAAAPSMEDRSAIDLLRIAPLRVLIVTSGLTVAAQELLAFYLPIYAHGLGHSASTIGVILDPANLVIEGAMDLRMALDMLGERVDFVHVKNIRWERTAAGRWRWRFDELADGQCDWAEVIPILREAGYDGWLSLENLWRVPVRHTGYVDEDIADASLPPRDIDQRLRGELAFLRALGA